MQNEPFRDYADSSAGFIDGFGRLRQRFYVAQIAQYLLGLSVP